MMRGQQKSNLLQDSSPSIASLRSSACFAVGHVCCWTTSVVLSITSIWLRLRSNDTPSESFFGLTGVGIWGSLPYAIASIFCVSTSKSKSYSSVKWLFITSIISFFCSTGIFSYSCMAIITEIFIETSSKKVIVAGILAGISLVEMVTSLLCCISCYSTIGCFTGTGRTNRHFHKQSRIFPSSEEGGNVTVMALPARQAAELFYSMYRPFFGTDVSNARERQFHNAPEADFMGFPPGTPLYVDAELTDDDGEFTGAYGPRRSRTVHRRIQEDETDTEDASSRPHNFGKATDYESEDEKVAVEGQNEQSRVENIKPTKEDKSRDHKLEKEG